MKSIFKILFVLNCLLLTVNCFAQPVTQQWVSRFPGDTASYSATASPLSIKMDSAGFIYVLAPSSYGHFGFLKYDANGNLVVTAMYDVPGYNYDEEASYFDVTGSGDVYMTGDVSINFNAWIATVKFNSAGVWQWTRIYNPDNQDGASAISIGKDGGLVIVGASTIGNMNYALTLKYDSQGNMLWVRNLNPGSRDITNDAEALDDSSNIYITGYVGDSTSVLKYRPSGDLVWFRAFNVGGFTSSGWGIAVDAFGSIYVMGGRYLAPGEDNFLLKLSNSGVENWSRVFAGFSGHLGLNQTYAAGPVITLDGMWIYYAASPSNGTGGGSSEIAVLKYDSSGDSIWVRGYWGTNSTLNFPANIKLDRYGNVYVCGLANYQTTGNDYITIRYSPAGVQQWVATYNGEVSNGEDAASDLFVDTNLNVYVTGVSASSHHYYDDGVTIKYSQPVGIISNGNGVPGKYKLFQNYPNPFNPSTVISYQLPRGSDVELVLYNSLGQLVKTIVSSRQSAGTYSVAINMQNYSSGIYFYRLKAGEQFEETKKMVLLK